MPGACPQEVRRREAHLLGQPQVSQRRPLPQVFVTTLACQISWENVRYLSKCSWSWQGASIASQLEPCPLIIQIFLIIKKYFSYFRQEPVVYVNGKPYTARDPAK